MTAYQIPKATTRVEHIVSNSRFIGTIGRADTVDDARAFIQAVRDEMPDASHHVYAYIIGYGSSVTEGMSDDGEPSGTSGPPTLAVLRGADIGDVVLVTTRYFGGRKLGTGGLVHAYGQTAKDAVAALEVELKIEYVTISFDVPYSLFEQVKLLLAQHEAQVNNEIFAGEVSLMLRVPEPNLPALTDDLRELSSGKINPTVLQP